MLSNAELSGFRSFVAVAELRSFRAAAEHLGVTRSAVSQNVRSLENRLGTALVQRTTRHVSLTDAGSELFSRLAPAFAEIASAIEAAVDREGRPSGQLRLAVSSIAERFLSGRFVAGFVERFPAIQLDVTVTDEEFDIVARGFHAGVRLGETLEQNMIAIPLSDDQRQLVVAAPAYLERHAAPAHPRDLPRHACIGWRSSADVAPYRWEFAEEGRDFDVDVRPAITTNDLTFMVRTAIAGAGLTFGLEETFRPYIRRGELVPLLESYCPEFAGFFLYFPERRNLAEKLRALVNYAHEQRMRDAAAGPISS